MAEKITKAMKLAEIKALIPTDRADLIEVIDSAIAGCTRKKTAKELAEAEKYEELKATVLSVLATEPMLIADIQASHEELTPLSNQKVSRMLTELVGEGKAVRSEQKGSRKAMYALVA